MARDIPATELGMGPTAQTSPAKAHARDIPVQIPGYKLLEELGEGGMGTVYRAEQESPRRLVAIKVLHTRSQSAWVRFQTEAQVMARFDHPGIARVLEAGEADGQPFLAMEFIEGTTLEKYVEKRPLRERLELFVQLCDAVHHAHVKAVIHRDLKPTNVMVRADGRVVVLDFGVARLADDSTPGATRAGELIGTPLYMSPEQARMRPEEIDARTDVYTLGVMLYELCSDELPHNGRGMPMPVLTVAICEDEPTPLGKRKPELRGGDLEAITMKALEKEPPRRYQSVAALGEDIRRYLANLPVSVRAPGTVERARRFVRRRPVAAFAIVGTTFGILSFAAIVTSLWLDARTARQTAEHERSLADDARGKAEAARDQLEVRNNQLVLAQARAALSRDPTETLTWLAQLTGKGVDAHTVQSIGDEARARGVAAAVLHGHTDEVHWVEPVQGGFVTGGYDGRAILWDPAPHPLYTAKHGRVHLVRPSPDGQRFAIGGDNGALVVVDRSGHLVAELPGHAGDVQHIAWAPDGTLASGDDQGNLLVWPNAHAPATKISTAGSAIGLVLYSPTGTLIAGDHLGHLFVGGKQLATGAEPIDAWADAHTVVVVDAEGTVRTWKDLAPTTTVTTGLKTKRAAFAPDGSFAVLGGIGGAVTRVDTQVTHLGQHHMQVRAVAVSPDGHWLATGSDDGSIEVRDLHSGRDIALRGHTGRIRHVAFAGSATLLSSDSDGIVRRWELAQVPPAVLEADAGPFHELASDGTRLAAAGPTGAIDVWTLADGGHHTLGSETARVTALAIAGATVISGTTEGTLTFWQPAPKRTKLAGSIKDIAVSKDRVAVATSEGPIALFTLAGDPLPPLAGNTGGTESVAFDRTGELLASGGQDRVVRVWHRDGTHEEHAGPTGDTHYVAYAGDRLISAGNDGVVFGDGQPIAHHTGAIGALALANGHVASAGRDDQVIVDLVATRLPAAATSLALTDDGTAYAVTRDGALVRITKGTAVVEIEQGVSSVLRAGEHIVHANNDGTLIVGP